VFEAAGSSSNRDSASHGAMGHTLHQTWLRYGRGITDADGPALPLRSGMPRGLDPLCEDLDWFGDSCLPEYPVRVLDPGTSLRVEILRGPSGRDPEDLAGLGEGSSRKDPVTVTKQGSWANRWRKENPHP